jgi:hypothetical protein
MEYVLAFGGLLLWVIFVTWWDRKAEAKKKAEQSRKEELARKAELQAELEVIRWETPYLTDEEATDVLNNKMSKDEAWILNEARRRIDREHAAQEAMIAHQREQQAKRDREDAVLRKVEELKRETF